jgi:hypothetical protein
MHRTTLSRCACLGAAALLLAGCSRLPGYARPHGMVREAGPHDAGDPIRYRALTTEDFRAPAPPEAVAAHAARIGAATCALIVPDGAPQVVVEPADGGGFRGVLAGVGFHAVMDRTCSWWNRGHAALPPEYVLEHEQIHFAIVELHARRLTAGFPVEPVRGGSAEEVAEALQRVYRSRVEEAAAAVLRESAAFDEDTSGRYRPNAQARWLRRVREALDAGG